MKYCQQNKGLVVYGYCVMTSHVHMIIGRNGEKSLDEIVRDMKSFTSQTYHKLIGDTMQVQECRKHWMQAMMKSHHNRKGRTDHFQFWQHHNKPTEIWSPQVFDEKLSYIHNNPVEAGFVTQPEHWLYSSARNYANLSAPIKIEYA